MKTIPIRLLLLLSSATLVCDDCTSNTGPKKKPMENDRQPAVAGQFYPGDKNSLKDSLSAMFKRAEPKKVTDPVLAIISPHAGYVFSGTVAASSFNQIEKKHYKNIFVIGSSHHALFNSASICLFDNYITPLGKVKVDRDLAHSLIKSNACFIEDYGADTVEHSIEVQIPFLQFVLGEDINLVPVLVGTQTESGCRQIAKALKPYFNNENLFIISTDLSHYPSYFDAQTSDKLITQAVSTNSDEKFMKALHQMESSGIPGLATAMCGWTSVLTLLNITKEMSDLSYTTISLKNSGDTKYGEKSRVVGYCSVVVTEKAGTESKQDDFLTADEKKKLLQIARETIKSYIPSGKTPKIDNKDFSKGLLQTCGAFVTLRENGDLRGCIGSFSADKPLYQTIQEMAISSSTRDYRFTPVSRDEIDKLWIEISVLTPMKKIKSIDEIVLGKHGIYIKKGGYSGTFLPQVASETKWTREEFLGHCARDKAGLDWDGWKDADIYTYEAIVFGE
jgi:MEMO1 family protein